MIDDYRTVPHALGVAAAAWEAVTDGRIAPVLASEQKLYALAAGREGPMREWLHRVASEDSPLPRVDQDVAGHRVMVFSAALMTTGHREEPAHDAPPEPEVTPPDLSDDVADLRQRLALIEGSRTWKLRTKLARFLPTRRTR